MKITIKDIAKIAGVNHSTVSRCLNDSPLVSKETKEKIKKLALEMGFEFNSSARSLSTQKTYTIGVITTAVFDGSDIGPFFGLLIKHILDNLEKYSYDAIVKFPDNYITGESNIKKLISKRKVDGLIIMHNYISNEDIEFVKKSGIPHVYLHTQPKYFDKNIDDSFITDHYFGGYIAAEYLYSKGYRKFTVITSMPYEEEFTNRTNGFMKYMSEKKIELSQVEIVEGDISLEYGRAFAIENYERIKETGVFVQADIIAVGMLSVIGVERKVGIIGYDDISLGKAYGLTTVHQPIEILASKAVARLVDLTSKTKSDTITTVIKPTIIVRET